MGEYCLDETQAFGLSAEAGGLEGLEKMKFLAGLGVKQAVLPPHERPRLPTLRRLGFTGGDGDILAAVQRVDPTLLAAVSSALAMWAANAATVSPSADMPTPGRFHAGQPGLDFSSIDPSADDGAGVKADFCG